MHKMILNILIFMASFLMITGCEISDINPDNSTDFQNKILQWYSNNSSRPEYQSVFTKTRSDMTIKLSNITIPSRSEVMDNNTIDPNKFPTESDKYTYAFLSIGLNTSTNEWLYGMVIPDKFSCAEIDEYYLIERYVITGMNDVEHLGILLELSENDTHYMLDKLQSHIINDGYHFYVLSGLDARDYKASVDSFLIDDTAQTAFINNPAKYKQEMGEMWNSSVTYGVGSMTLDEYSFTQTGDHDSDEVLLALKLLYHDIGRDKTDEEIFWSKWVLGLLSDLELGNYPSLESVKPANVVIGGSTLIITELTPGIKNWKDMKEYIENGRIDELKPCPVIIGKSEYPQP